MDKLGAQVSCFYMNWNNSKADLEIECLSCLSKVDTRISLGNDSYLTSLSYLTLYHIASVSYYLGFILLVRALIHEWHKGETLWKCLNIKAVSIMLTFDWVTRIEVGLKFTAYISAAQWIYRLIKTCNALYVFCLQE